MTEFLRSTPAQIVIWLTVLLILIATAFYVVKKFRDQTGDDRLSANQLLTNFRELHEQGDIEADEFRNIKTVLGVQLQDEATDSGDSV